MTWRVHYLLELKMTSYSVAAALTISPYLVLLLLLKLVLVLLLLLVLLLHGQHHLLRVREHVRAAAAGVAAAEGAVSTVSAVRPPVVSAAVGRGVVSSVSVGVLLL